MIDTSNALWSSTTPAEELMSHCSCLTVVAPPNGRSSRSTRFFATLEPWPCRTILLTNSYPLHHVTVNPFTQQPQRGSSSRTHHRQSTTQQQLFKSPPIKNYIPDYKFSHLLHSQDHIANYRRTCSSVNSMMSPVRDIQQQSPDHGNKMSQYNTSNKKQQTQALKERVATERRSVEVNYVLFQYPKNNDNSFSYRPLLFARGTFPGNGVSKLLAEYWSSASSTVESAMKVKGNGVYGEEPSKESDKRREMGIFTAATTIIKENANKFSIKATKNEEDEDKAQQSSALKKRNNSSSQEKSDDVCTQCTCNNNKLIQRDFSARKVDYPIFTTEDDTSEDITTRSTSSADKKTIIGSVYSNPFEYSRESGGEEDSTAVTHKSSGRLLAARMRAISDSGIASENEDIKDTLQSKSLLKSSHDMIVPSSTSSTHSKSNSYKDHLQLVQPSNSLPNIFNNPTFPTQTKILPPPIGYYNRDLLYVGIDPAGCKASSASTEINTVPASVSARVKHRLTLNTPLLADPLTTKTTTTVTSKSQPKRRHTARCFKRSLNRRRASVTNKWIFVESYSVNSQKTNALPTLDDVLNAE